MQTASRQILRQHSRFYTYCPFRTQPICGGATGVVATGTTGFTNVMVFPEAAFEYFILGAGQTLIAPSISATGLLASLDLTNNEGAEYTQGITARSPSAFTVGTHACFLKIKFTVADVSGTDHCFVGFRKTQAYQTALATYTDFAVIGPVNGAIKTVTDKNDAGEVTTDTTDTWADGASKTLGVYVSSGGVVTYKIDGVAPTTVAAFTFDSTDVIIPFFFMLHDVTSPGAITLESWECGLQ